MKKSIICTILGIAVGLGLGKMTNDVETIIIRDEKNVELNTIHTYLEKFVEVTDNCKICGEELYDYEKNVCIYCKDFVEGYVKGVEETKEKYGIVEEGL